MLKLTRPNKIPKRSVESGSDPVEEIVQELYFFGSECGKCIGYHKALECPFQQSALFISDRMDQMMDIFAQ